MSKKATPSNVIALPPDWKAAFHSSAMRTSFCLALTQPMLEFLCAVADGVHWDRRLYYRQWGMAKPDSFLVSGAALVKRGLIERLPQSQISGHPLDEDRFHAHHQLTPAGVALVELLRVSGIFVEADTAIEKRTKAKR